jgi:pimeloyl-ACP methyl ester carboxylesterase
MNRRFISMAAVAFATSIIAFAAQAAEVKNIVIVHGALADGSGWRKATEILVERGFNVTIVQEPITSLADDVAATNRVLDLQDGPSLLVGHSYGGMVITEAGNNPHVAGLVYVAAFQPDKGESLLCLASSKPAGGMNIRETKDGNISISTPRHSRPTLPATFRKTTLIFSPDHRSSPPSRLSRPRSASRPGRREELVDRRNPGSFDQSRSRTGHGPTFRQQRDRDCGKPRRLRLPARKSRRCDREGGKSPFTLKPGRSPIKLSRAFLGRGFCYAPSGTPSGKRRVMPMASSKASSWLTTRSAPS